ncbi:MAG: HAMP domain-containing sensor histidine kinase [Actinomycetota bacterium]
MVVRFDLGRVYRPRSHAATVATRVDLSRYVVLVAALCAAFLAVTAFGWPSDERAAEEARDLVREYHLALMMGEPLNDVAIEPHQYATIHTPSGLPINFGLRPSAGVVRHFERQAVLTLNDTLATQPPQFSGDGWSVRAMACSQQNRCTYLLAGSQRQSYLQFVRSQLTEPIALLLLLPIVAFAVEYRVRRRIGGSLQAVERQVAQVGTGDERTIKAGDNSTPEVAQLVASTNEAIGRYELALGRDARVLAETVHDLRSPLSAASVLVDLAVKNGSVDLLPDCAAEIKRAGTMIDGILLMSRTGSQAKHLVDLDVTEVVIHAVDATRLRFRDVRIETDLDAVTGQLNPKAIESIASNLLENAAKYSRNRIRVTLAESEGSLHLSVEDNGEGIDPSDYDRVLSWAGRADDASGLTDLPSEGLGLSIVREAVRIQRGVVRLGQSDLGGCRFDVVIPLFPS